MSVDGTRARVEAALAARMWIVASVSCATVFVMLVARRPDQIINPQFWAEDGAIYFAEAWERGVGAFAIPYAGQYFSLHRLAAYLISWCSPGYAPALYVGSALVVTALVACHLFMSRLSFSPLERVAMALAIVAVPLNFEVFLTLTNVHWIACLSLALVLVSRDANTPRQLAFDLGVLAIVGLSGPFLVFLTPLFIARWLYRRTSASRTLAWATIVVAAIQATALHTRPPFAAPTLWSVGLAGQLGERLFALFGVSRTAWPPGFTGLIWAPAAAVCLWLAYDAWRSGSWTRGAFLAVGVLVLAPALWTFLNLEILRHTGDRYFYIPAVMLIWNLVLVRGFGRWAARALLVCAAVTFAVHHRSAPLIDYHWREASACIGVRPTCEIAINPPGWKVVVRSRQ